MSRALISRARIAVSLLLAAHLLALVAVAASASPAGSLPVPAARPAVAAPVAKPVRTAPAPRPVALAPKSAPVRRPVTSPRVRRTAPTAARTFPTAQQRLDAAVARIPGYRAGSARWVLHAKDGYWGTADWYRNTIYISPKVPASRLYDVVVHEWSHLLTVRAYSNDPGLAMAETNRFFGGTGVAGAEKAADCMARQLGGRWTHYTSCTSTTWQAGASRLLRGQPA